MVSGKSVIQKWKDFLASQRALLLSCQDSSFSLLLQKNIQEAQSFLDSLDSYEGEKPLIPLSGNHRFSTFVQNTSAQEKPLPQVHFEKPMHLEPSRSYRKSR